MYICTHVDIYIYISIYIVVVQWIYIYIYIYEYMDMCRHITSPFVNQLATSRRRAGGRVIRLDRRSDIVGRVWLSSSGPGVNGLVGRGSSLR